MTSSRRNSSGLKAASSHRFFRDFDWGVVETRQHAAFYVPFQKKAAFSWHPGNQKKQATAISRSNMNSVSISSDNGTGTSGRGQGQGYGGGMKRDGSGNSGSVISTSGMSGIGTNSSNAQPIPSIDQSYIYSGDQGIFSKFDQACF